MPAKFQTENGKVKTDLVERQKLTESSSSLIVPLFLLHILLLFRVR